MKIHQELASERPDRDTALTIGVFDGMHRGHSHLVDRLVAQAKSAGRLSVVLTFRNHPDSVLRSEFRPQYITGLDERISLIKDRGVDLVVPITFNLELSKLRMHAFIDLLQDRLRMRELVVGPDFALGYQREGDIAALGALGAAKGFAVSVVPLFEEGGLSIRSTAVRHALALGDLDRVRWMLGRPFALTGIVSRGDGRGKQLGYPTANIEVAEGMAVPGDGIYATWAYVDGKRHMSSTSIGTRPTFGEGRRTIEAYLMGFEGDIYGKQMRLHFVRRLRDELRFDNVEALVAQIGDDVEKSRQVLGMDEAPSE